MADAPSKPHDIVPVTIEEEMRRSYLDYAMSVIVARALPDVRDGLKPVHRRILYAMKEAGYDWNRAYRKAARVVGDVMGKYHPHGDTAIYDAMVRMAQDFSMRLPLIDGQGNFGSMDGDPPAAMRYTEVRLARSAEALLDDIDKDTVDFQPNYDDTGREPRVLPARFPNLLVNGAGGIAVGMATNIPTHNLGEVIDACCAIIADPAIDDADLMAIVPGPDFPTGGIIVGRRGIREAYLSGRGSIVVRSKADVEEIRKDREAIVVTEIPFQVNKSRMMERIAETVNEKLIDGISDLRDESDRDGVRVVIELKRDANPEVVLKQLYRFTPLETTFGINMLALDAGRPVLMGLRRVIDAFLAFREEVVTRRTAYELARVRERAHILVGLALAVANLDEVIALIRAAPDPATARAELLARAWPVHDIAPLIRLIDEPEHPIVDGAYRLSDEQAKAILDLRLQRLTGLEREKIAEELEAIVRQITDYLDILRSRPRRLEIIRDDLLAIREQFGTPRRTRIDEAEDETDLEDLIKPEPMVVTVSHGGYIKRTPLATYRAQRRGGKGRSGMATREEDFVAQVFVAGTHAPVLFFTSLGKVYLLKVWRLPPGTPTSRGKPMVQLLPLDAKAGERVTSVLALPEDKEAHAGCSLMFATSTGNVRRNDLADFTNVKANGKIAMRLEEEGERLVGVVLCDETQDVLIATRGGKCIRFPVPEVRVFQSRTSTGVRGIRLADGDEVIDISILRHVEADAGTRVAYLRRAAQERRAPADDGGIDEPANDTDEGADAEAAAPERPLSDEEYAALAASEDLVLTVTANGFGKRTSAYEYRVTRRGGQGIANIAASARNGPVVASFPVPADAEIMLVTDGGQVIRMPVADIRIAGRPTQGVILLRVAEGERVMSAARLPREEADGDEPGEAESGEAPPAAPDEGAP
ncbi:MAG: DNA gyrase subunit A [Alphaproteobacteria bacterium]|nr:DNA gyrase subunit A [Alphaproteobacteria bacterium]